MHCMRCGCEISTSICTICGYDNSQEEKSQTTSTASTSYYVGEPISETLFSAEMQYDIAKRFAEAKNYGEVEKWLQLPARKGHVGALLLLAVMYELFPPYVDIEKALFFYNQAASRGDSTAINGLIRLYSNDPKANKDKLEYWRKKQNTACDSTLAKKYGEATAVKTTPQEDPHICRLSDYEIEDGVLLRYNGTDAMIRLPDGITAIADFAFSNEDGVSGGNEHIISVRIPEGVVRIGNYAFFEVYYLNNVDLPSTLREIGTEAFCGTSLKKIALPEGLTSLGEEQTFSNTDLREITIPGSVTAIPFACFWGCSKLETVKLESGVRVIEQGSFEDCKALHTVIIPDTVETIEEGGLAFTGAFSGCTALRTVIASASWKLAHAKELASMLSK